MPPKREQSVTVRLSEDEAYRLRKLASQWDMEVSEIVRCCMAVALPILSDVDFVRRVRLEDSKIMNTTQ